MSLIHHFGYNPAYNIGDEKLSHTRFDTPASKEVKESDKSVRFISIFLFVAGVLFALVLTFFALWPDFEAALFDPTHSGGESLNSLRCPLLITSSDEAAIRLTLTNPLDRPVNFLTQANISEGFVTLVRQEISQVMVQPGERAQLAWSVTPEDAVYERLILARVRVLRASGLPARQKACGILVLNVPVVRGNQIIGGLLGATLLYLGLGALLWLRNERPLTSRQQELGRAVGLFALLLLLTMGISFLGWWGGAILIILVMLLLLVAFLERLSIQK